MGTAIKHPVPDRVKPYVICNFWHPGTLTFNPERHAQPWASEWPDVKNYKWLLNPVWHRMLYSCTHNMATVGIEGLNLLLGIDLSLTFLRNISDHFKCLILCSCFNFRLFLSSTQMLNSKHMQTLLFIMLLQILRSLLQPICKVQLYCFIITRASLQQPRPVP